MNDTWYVAGMLYLMIGAVWACTASLVYIMRLVEKDSKPRYIIVLLFLLYSIFWIFPCLGYTYKYSKLFIRWLTYKD